MSFKLETDLAILRIKLMLAMEKSGVHLVVGNVLSTRHERASSPTQRKDTGARQRRGWKTLRPGAMVIIASVRSPLMEQAARTISNLPRSNM